MKDYDDLWRLTKCKIKIDEKKFQRMVKKREIPLSLNTQWIGPDLERMWKNHRKRYQDLPGELEVVFEEINLWLGRFES